MKKQILAAAIFLACAFVIYKEVTDKDSRCPEGDSPCSVHAPTRENRNSSISANIDPENWKERLYSPTYIERLGNKWFIVDCWHSRILWNTSLNGDLSKWNVMDDKFSSHTIAYDDHKYLATEDTEHGGITFYVFKNGKYAKVSELKGLGKRTHRISFDKERNSFIMISATSGDMWRISINNDTPKIISHSVLSFAKPDSNVFEIRTFTIHDNKIYFVSSMATKKIYVTTNDDNYRVLYDIPVNKDFENMQDIYFNDDGSIIITASPSSFALLKSEKEIPSASNQYNKYGFSGSPYLITKHDGMLFIPEIGAYNGVSKWSYSDGVLKRIGVVIANTPPSKSDELKKSEIVFQ